MLKVDVLSYHLNLNWDQQVSSLIMQWSHMLFIMVELNLGKKFYVDIMVEYEWGCISAVSKCFYSLWQTFQSTVNRICSESGFAWHNLQATQSKLILD